MLKDGEFSYGSNFNCECSICHRELTVPESIYFGMVQYIENTIIIKLKITKRSVTLCVKQKYKIFPKHKIPKTCHFYPVGFTYICFYKPHNYAKQKIHQGRNVKAFS